MTNIFLGDIPMHTSGHQLKVGSLAPNFIATTIDLASVSLEDVAGKPVLINVYPSIDTSVCFDSVKKFNEKSQKSQEDLVIFCISMDLPFALKRISIAESFDNIILLSDFRNREFGARYGLTIIDGPLAGLLARAVIVLDKDHKIAHFDLVKDISNPPDYVSALNCL
jgi:thiol peroxidase